MRKVGFDCLPLMRSGEGVVMDKYVTYKLREKEREKDETR